MPERRDDLHADRSPIGMRLARNADSRQSRRVDPGAKHPLRHGRETRRRLVLGAPRGRRGGGTDQRVVLSPRGGYVGAPGGERIHRVDIIWRRYRETAFGGGANVVACFVTPTI